MEMYLKFYGIDYRLGLDSLKVDDTLEKWVSFMKENF